MSNTQTITVKIPEKCADNRFAVVPATFSGEQVQLLVDISNYCKNDSVKLNLIQQDIAIQSGQIDYTGQRTASVNIQLHSGDIEKLKKDYPHFGYVEIRDTAHTLLAPDSAEYRKDSVSFTTSRSSGTILENAEIDEAGALIYRIYAYSITDAK